MKSTNLQINCQLSIIKATAGVKTKAVKAEGVQTKGVKAEGVQTKGIGNCN